MVFFSLETPEPAVTPGFVSMSSLLALFSCKKNHLVSNQKEAVSALLVKKLMVQRWMVKVLKP